MLCSRKTVHIYCSEFYKIDRKFIKRLVGIEAAYHTMCNLLEQQCHDLEFAENGFYINTTFQDIRLVAESQSSATGKICQHYLTMSREKE